MIKSLFDTPAKAYNLGYFVALSIAQKLVTLNIDNFYGSTFSSEKLVRFLLIYSPGKNKTYLLWLLTFIPFLPGTFPFCSSHVLILRVFDFISAVQIFWWDFSKEICEMACVRAKWPTCSPKNLKMSYEIENIAVSNCG